MEIEIAAYTKKYADFDAILSANQNISKLSNAKLKILPLPLK